MPIYAYRCGACGHARDVLQKLSDPILTTCLACGADAFTKQLTAAGFQLKGSGWYVTDFRDGGQGKEKDKAKATDESGASPLTDGAAQTPASDTAPSKPSATTPESATTGSKADGQRAGASAPASGAAAPATAPSTAPASKPASTPPSTGR